MSTMGGLASEINRVRSVYPSISSSEAEAVARMNLDHRYGMVNPLLASFIWNTGSSSPATPAQPAAHDHVVQQLKDLHEKGHDLKPVKEHIDKIEAEQQAKTHKALDGLLEVAKLGKVKARRFRIAYKAKDGEAKIAEGVEHHDDRADKSKEDSARRVHVAPTADFPVRSAHNSMKALKETLDANNIAHRIDYVD